jgi:hypothetical protein
MWSVIRVHNKSLPQISKETLNLDFLNNVGNVGDALQDEHEPFGGQRWNV